MSVSNIIVTLVIIALIIAGAAYFMGYFDAAPMVEPAATTTPAPATTPAPSN
ncbi:hypothetical protein [Acuticoccus kandeliae]|uniref:hypothetical protein n=1 Tax=Acuticoccus kandeliae TaxID=2073160 RepID=UPI001300B351|nr:hypothetical protein [Acuticoccus kandeliae]